METLKKNDFIELEFSGKANNELFDTTNKEEAKKLGIEADVKPMIISIGNQMLLKGFDDALEGKEIGKLYKIHLSPDKAFGPRNPQMLKTIPMRVFKEKNIQPYPGLTLQMDNYLAKVLSVSGGRVIMDFNNPLAGKEIDYEFTIKRKIDDDKEKVNAILDFFLRQRFEFEIKEENSNKKVVFKDENIKQIIGIFAEKFKKMTGLEFEVPKQDTKIKARVEELVGKDKDKKE